MLLSDVLLHGILGRFHSQRRQSLRDNAHRSAIGDEISESFLVWLVSGGSGVLLPTGF